MLINEVTEDLRAWFGKGKKGGAGGGGWDPIIAKVNALANAETVKKVKANPKCPRIMCPSPRAKGGKSNSPPVRKKRRNDPKKNPGGKAKNVSNTTRK